MAVKCDIVSSEVVQGRTAYTISVEREGGRQSLLRRHYTDFLALDQEEPVKCLAPESKPTLPPKGRLGLRHRLNLGSFNEQRLEGLRQYLTQLLRTEAGTSDAVEKFLAVPLETATTGSVIAPLALEKFLCAAEDALLTGSTATPRSDAQAPDEEAAEGKEPGNYRLLPSTGTWLLCPQPRLPAADDAAAPSAAAADVATAATTSAASQEAPPSETAAGPQAEEAQPTSYRLLPSTGTWLLRLPDRQPASGEQADAGTADAAEPIEAAAPVEEMPTAPAEAAASADAAPAYAEAVTSNSAAAEPAQAVAKKSKSARRRAARNKARASAQ